MYKLYKYFNSFVCFVEILEKFILSNKVTLSEACAIFLLWSFNSQEENVLKNLRFLHFCLGVRKRYFILEQIWCGLVSMSDRACVVGCAHWSGTGCGQRGWGFQVVDQVGQVGNVAV